MSKLPEIHLCLQQPAGYVHSLGLLDPARYFRYQFRRLGANVTMAKNRLRHDALNFVFGAHLGFDASLRERHACVFVNLEQLGEGGAQVSADYLKLLAGSAVVDYDADNRAAYAAEVDDVPVVPILHAPYLKPAQSVPLEERPIDLLFIGSMNERRRAWLDRIEALGLSVAMFDGPMYGPERDGFIAQAKAVVNAHFYETSRFEQVRVSHCLSLGTPVLAERTEYTRAHPAFEECVLWMQGGDLEQFFAEDFGTPMFYDVAREALARFEQADPIEAYADLLAFAAGFAGAHHERRAASAWQPQRIHLGAGASYRPGWLNIDMQDKTEPDLKLDLAATLPLPLFAHSGTAGPIELAEHSVELIRATAVPAAWADWMGNCLRLLQTGGELHIEMPIEHARAVDAQVWRDCTEGFWTLGWFEHRFDLSQFTFIDARRQECAPELATGLHVRLSKVATSMRERVDARSLQVNLRVDEDFADDVVVAVSATALPSAPPVLLAAVPAQDTSPMPVPTPVPHALALLRRQPQTA